MSFNFLDFLDVTRTVNKKLASGIVLITLLLSMCCPPVNKWLLNQAIQRAQATIAPITKAYMDGLLKQTSLRPVQQPAKH